MPGGIAWVKSMTMGKTLIVLGPERSGKTSFIDYLLTGSLRPEGVVTKTHEIEHLRHIQISVGDHENANIQIKTAMDVPGVLVEAMQAWLLKDKAPDYLILVFDLSMPAVSFNNWLGEFTHTLQTHLLNTPKGVRIMNHLAGVLVILNKRDKVSPSVWQRRKRKVGVLLETPLNSALDQPLRVDIVPGILVEQDKGDQYARSAVATMAKAFHRL